MIETEKYIRKPLYVDAVRVTNANFDEIATWCQGEVQQDEGQTKKHIKVRVHNPKNPRQTRAFVGDWLLYTERGYKVYTNKAFHASFNQVNPEAAAAIATTPPPAGQKFTTSSTEVTAPIEEVELQSVGPVAEEPSAETGVGNVETVEEVAEPVKPLLPYGTETEGETEEPVVSHEYEPVSEMAQAVETIEAEGGTVEPATPEAIADAVAQNEQARLEAAADGKRILTIEEQQQMGQDEIRELIQSGEAILVQDLAA